MKDSSKSSRVSPAQARVIKPKPSRPNAVRSKNHLAWYVPLGTKPKQPEKKNSHIPQIKQSEKNSHIPQIKWKCPPKIALSTGWHVAAGEGSQEAKVQKRRESALSEVVYRDLTAIPPCPFAPPLVKGDCHDDSQTPIIPIIPIEEVAEETRLNSSATTNTSINPKPSADLPISQSDPSEVQELGKSLPNKLHEIAAAAVTVAAFMQNKDQIDTELLIKFLSNPELIKKVMSENGSTSKPAVEEAPPQPPPPPPPPPPKAIISSPLPKLDRIPVVDKLADGGNKPVTKAMVSSPLPKLAPLPVVDKLANGGNIPVTKAIISSPLPKLAPLPVADKLANGGNKPVTKAIVSSPLPKLAPQPVVDTLANGGNKPVTKAMVSISTSEPVNRPLLSTSETEIKKPASTLGGPKHTPKATNGPSLSPRFNFCTNQIAREQKVRPPLPSAPRHEDQNFERLLKKYAGPNVTGVKPVDSFNPSPSFLNSDNPVSREQKVRPLLPPTLRHDGEKFDSLVKNYGGPNITGPKPTDSFHSPPSMVNSEAFKKLIHDYGAPDADRVKPTPPKTEDIQRTVEKYLPYDQGRRQPNFIRPNPPLLAPTPPPPPGIFRPPFAPRTREFDLEYQKSLIKKHGEVHETMDGRVPRTCQSGNYNYLQGVERSSHKITTTIETNPKIQRPCLYFGSPTGCRNGNNCMFQHNVPEQWKMGQVSKKMKLNEEFGKWH